MAKFRDRAPGRRGPEPVTNYMGSLSFKQSPEEELAFACMTSFIESSYYEKAENRLDRIKELIGEVATIDPVFVAKLGIVLRNEFHMRSAYHVLVGELAKVHKGDSLVRTLMADSVERPDDVLEILAYVGKPIPNQVKKGAAEALKKFNEYQLAKYKSEGSDFKMVDAFNLVHPSPDGAKQQTLFKHLIEGRLKAPDTWEVRLSSGESHRSVWRDLVLNDKIGYMALLRNLRNIMIYADDETFGAAVSKLTNREAVLASKQLPFRFLSAYTAISEAEKSRESSLNVMFENDKHRVAFVQGALNKAVAFSVENIPVLSGRTMILIDNSGSMRGDYGGKSLVSAMSSRTTADIANLFGTLYWTRANNTYVGLFGDCLIEPSLDRAKTVFENFNIINSAARECGPGTEQGIFEAFRRLIRSRTMVDRVVIFSDTQIGDGNAWYGTEGRATDSGTFNGLFQEYKKINPDLMAYCVDLRGYGNKPIAKGIINLSGWSDKIFEIMQVAEKGDALVDYIKGYEWGSRKKEQQ